VVPDASIVQWQQPKRCTIIRILSSTDHAETPMMIATRQDCRYWPEIHELRTNRIMGTIIPVRPGRVTKVLDTQSHIYKAFKQNINLISQSLAGPFNAENLREQDNKADRVLTKEGVKLQSTAQRHQINTDNICTIPLTCITTIYNIRA